MKAKKVKKATDTPTPGTSYAEPPEHWTLTRGFHSSFTPEERLLQEMMASMSAALVVGDRDVASELATRIFAREELIQKASEESGNHQLYEILQHLEEGFTKLITPDPSFDQDINQTVYRVRDPDISMEVFARKPKFLDIVIPQVAGAIQLLRSSYGNRVYRPLLTSSSQLSKWTHPTKPASPRKWTLFLVVSRLSDFGVRFEPEYGMSIDNRAFKAGLDPNYEEWLRAMGLLAENP